MLTNDELQRLKRYVDLVPYLDREWQEKLFKLIRDLKAAEGQEVMPQSAVQAMVDAVPDKLMADIVSDFRHGVPAPSGLLKSEPTAPVVRGSGWAEPPRAKDRTNEFRIFDRMVERMAGGPNGTSKLR